MPDAILKLGQAGPLLYRRDILREQRVLMPMAGLPRIIRALVTSGK